MANIEGHGAPRGSTVGAIGDIYKDIDNGRTYKCTGIYIISTMKPDVSEISYEWSRLANEADADATKEEVITQMEQYVQLFMESYDLTWTDGGYISKHDGTVNEEEGSSYSDFVSVEPGMKLIISNTMTADTEWNAFYDSAQSYLSSFSTNNRSMVTVPDGAKYFRLSKYTSATVVIFKSIQDSISNHIGGIENGTY